MDNDKLKQFKTTDGTIIPYQIQGNGTPIIFLHGLFGKMKDFKEIIKSVSKTHCCVSFDQRGHGQSKATTGFNIKQFAQDLKDLINHLNLNNIILLGYSMGGFTIFNYIEQFGCDNIKKIILVDITPKMINDTSWTNGLYQGEYFQGNLDTDLQDINKDFMKFAAYFTYRNMTKATHGQPYRKKATLISKILTRLLIKNTQTNRNLSYSLWEDIAKLDYRNILDNFLVPTALFYGDPGSLFAPKTALYMQSKIPNAKVVPFYNASHALLFSHSKQFIKELIEFI